MVWEYINDLISKFKQMFTFIFLPVHTVIIVSEIKFTLGCPDLRGSSYYKLRTIKKRSMRDVEIINNPDKIYDIVFTVMIQISFLVAAERLRF